MPTAERGGDRAEMAIHTLALKTGSRPHWRPHLLAPLPSDAPSASDTSAAAGVVDAETPGTSQAFPTPYRSEMLPY
jgi:hypothetical protein